MKNKMTLNETVKEALGIALFQLMETRPYAEITIREIAEVAGVSRSSFYRNFNTKEELLNTYITSLYLAAFETELMPAGPGGTAEIEAFLEPRFRFVREHQHIYRALYRNDLLYPFFCRAEKSLVLLLCGEDERMSVYHRAMISGACAGVIRCWIENGFGEDEKTMAKRFSTPFGHMFPAFDEERTHKMDE